jgi:hypothetical protein
MTEPELIIDETNFSKYFFDVRNHTLQKGQIMVRYSAIAEFVSSNEKKQMIDLLHMPNKGVSASQIMKNLLYATEGDSIRIPREIAEDMANGMTREQVLEKPYKYKMEIFYYCDPKYLPADPHWDSISLLNL